MPGWIPGIRRHSAGLGALGLGSLLGMGHCPQSPHLGSAGLPVISFPPSQEDEVEHIAMIILSFKLFSRRKWLFKKKQAAEEN